MACLEMYKNSASPQQQSQCISPSPRISFSNDFVESSHHNPTCQHSQSESTPPRSSDFEFSVTNNNMLCADELFFKGRLLPFKDHPTLRDELLNDHHYHDNDYDHVKTPTKMASCKWKAFLGLTRSHFGSKKPAQNDASLDAAPTFFSFQPQNNTLLTKPPQEMQNCSEDYSVAVSTDVEMKS